MKGTFNNIPNSQISGDHPNYTHNGRQGQHFDGSRIPQSTNDNELKQGINSQQKFVQNYNQYNSNTTTYRNENNNTNLENLRDFSQFNIQENFKKVLPIEKMKNTEYQNNTLYNNLNENLLKESIREIRLNIDSADRDVNLYPDPFSYVVSFGPVVNSGVDTTIKRNNLKTELKESLKYNNNKNKNNNNKNEEELLYDESSQFLVNYEDHLKKIFNPQIIRTFHNIKFIRLDNVILPRFNHLNINSNIIFGNYDKNNENKIFIKDDYDRIKVQFTSQSRYTPDDINFGSILFTDRFIQVDIKEIQNNYNLATNTISSNSFVVFPDKQVGILYWRGNPYYAVKIYNDSLLGTINKLTIKFYDSWGNPITLNTKSIDYETKQIMNTDLIKVHAINIDEHLRDEYKKKFLINKLTEILKCFIIINYDIKCKIPFYIDKKFDEQNNNLEFQKYLKKYSKLHINRKDFFIENLYEELNSFVSVNGFINSSKLLKNNNEKTMNINDYINNVIWCETNQKDEKDQIKIENNIKALFTNYKIFGFEILDKLKMETINIPFCKYFQNHLTFVMGIFDNELNTKIDHVV